MFETPNLIAKYYFNGENTTKNYDSVCLIVNYGSKFYSTGNTSTRRILWDRHNSNTQAPHLSIITAPGTE